jgi:hypothetical protein
MCTWTDSISIMRYRGDTCISPSQYVDSLYCILYIYMQTDISKPTDYLRIRTDSSMYYTFACSFKFVPFLTTTEKIIYNGLKLSFLNRYR